MCVRLKPCRLKKRISMNNWKKILLLLAVCWPFGGQAALFKAEEFTLENGLHCVVIQNHKAPIVKQMVWYKVGAVDELRGRGGSAHLLEHLMFRGTQKVKDGEFNRILSENGAQSNAFTSYDVTAYHQFADVSRLEVLMALEADRMQNLNFDEEAFKAEQKIVFQERKQVVENNPAAPFSERLSRIFWGNSPYGHPITGLSSEIMALTYDDVRQFYEKYYAPNNAVLVLAGDIDTETARALAQKYYGGIPARPAERTAPELVSDKFSEILTMRLPQITTPKLFYRYMLPKYNAVKGSFYDYLVLAEYLGGGQTSALYRDLVIRHKASVSVAANYQFVSGGNSVFSVSLVPAEGYDIRQVEHLLRTSLATALQNLTEKKVDKVKRKMLADLVFANDNPEDAAYWVGYMMANGFTLKEILDYENGIEAVTLNGIKEAYAEVFENSARVEGILLPEKEDGHE